MKLKKKYLIFVVLIIVIIIASGVSRLDSNNNAEKLYFGVASPATQKDMDENGKMSLLKKIEFHAKENDSDLSQHTSLSNLEELGIASEEGADFGLDNNNDVVELDFGYANSVTQEDINEIGKMNSLKKLDFFIDSSDIDLSPLTNLNNLEELCITSGWEGNGSLNTEPIGELKQIKKITLIECEFDTSFLAQLTNLESVLLLKCTEFEDLSAFENLKGLQDISISYVDDADLNYLKNLTELKTINIVGANMRNFDGLKNLTNVEELILRESWIEYKDQIINMEVFVNMYKLTNISIERKRIIDISPLAEIEGLEMITLADTGVSDISPLANLENLRELTIIGNKSVQVEEQAKKLFTKVERVFISEEVFN